MKRRLILQAGASVLGGVLLDGCGGGGGGSDPATPPVTAKSRVVVVGGGMAGATVAKYLRMWGDAVEVTLVERSASYTSSIMSSLVLTGQRSMSSLSFSYAALRERWGVEVLTDTVTAVDPSVPSVTLASGRTLVADHVVLAPGIEFDTVAGLDDPDRMPHAWKAGAQTSLLAQQLAAMPAGGVAILTIPPTPYRCPPGPYERACLLADWLRVNKPGSKLLVLDANPGIVVEQDNFTRAFEQLHAGVVEYHGGVAIDHVDSATMTLHTNGGAFAADVVNLIPRQRAGALIASAGLANDASGRFAAVDVLDYASTLAPRVHVIGDSAATTQPKAGHIANQEAKVCADAIVRRLAGGAPDPAPVTNSSCFSTITMDQASWLHAVFQYDAASATMKSVAAATGASSGWNRDHYEDMHTWFGSLMSDSFA
ncbi:FAD-dependent oxidoreductase [Rubrivivax gelatinosus]|uniref:NADH dehydrogenase FAD-containing subunit n=1 Tax=Rubrivivax gelatinosus TaxID=28068 RepID=A0A4R2MCQ9_RUBGE|nr:FAD/NAD(P)-binding oxidoreductase [Rubrivivax gelatinosus]MBK1686424.1 hypothetical protein [Rubrivivax gelatinosus]TCP04350.1 NADH dehydrogenase FAD-containing subunit [Rubrivivax gelatinosus]